MKAREIMTPNPEVVTPDDPISRAAGIMRDCDIGMVPVVNDTNSMSLQGVITDRDIAIRHVADGHTGDCTVAAHMTRDDIETVREHDDSAKVLAAMERREVRRMPVCSEDGKLVGVIAQADIATCDRIAPDDVAELVKTVSEPNAGR